MGTAHSKFKASITHLAFNLVIFSLMLLVMLSLWYPPPFFTASGGLQGIKIVALVDIVLGPLLTLVIYNRSKPPKLLLMDIALIFTLQIAAFVWGVWTVYQQRPVAISFWENGFYSVPAIELKNQGDYLTELEKFGENLPVMVYVDRSMTAVGYKKLREAIDKHNNKPPYAILELFENYRENMEKILEFEISPAALAQLMAEEPQALAQLEKLETQSGKTREQLHFVWIKSKYQNPVIIFDQQGDILGFLTMPYKPKDRV